MKQHLYQLRPATFMLTCLTSCLSLVKRSLIQDISDLGDIYIKTIFIILPLSSAFFLGITFKHTAIKYNPFRSDVTEFYIN